MLDRGWLGKEGADHFAHTTYCLSERESPSPRPMSSWSTLARACKPFQSRFVALVARDATRVYWLAVPATAGGKDWIRSIMAEIFYRIMPKKRFFPTNLTLIENELRPDNAVNCAHDLDLSSIKAIAPSKYPYAKQRIVERPFFARWWPVRLLEDATPLRQAGEAPPAPTSAA